MKKALPRVIKETRRFQSFSMNTCELEISATRALAPEVETRRSKDLAAIIVHDLRQLGSFANTRVEKNSQTRTSSLETLELRDGRMKHATVRGANECMFNLNV